MSQELDHPPVASLSLGERFAKPGVVLHTEGNIAFSELHRQLLEAKLEVKVGEYHVKKIDFSADGLQAYVEFEDEADIDKVLNTELKLSKDKPPLFIERCDLAKVLRPYLVVRGLEDWIEEYVEEHFKEIAKGAAIEFVKIKDNAAEIMFVNPQAALEFPPTTDLLGLTLDLEVAYSSQREQMVLAVKGLPSGRIPESRLRGALVSHFSKHTGYKAAECKIIKGVGYMTFDHPAGLKILSNPPTANFFGKTSLEVSSAPISQTCEDPSIAFDHTHLSEVKLCSATCPNGVRVSVYKGEFTKHNHVDLIVVFIPPNQNQQNDTNLKLLFAAGGAELQEDFDKKISQLFKQSAGDLFASHPGKLQCSQVLYCFIPPWSSNSGPNGEYYLLDCLGKVLGKTQSYNTILFASACSLPLKYPADVFARNIIDSITSCPFISSVLTVAVYVSEGSHGMEFEKHFQASNCVVDQDPIQDIEENLSKGRMINRSHAHSMFVGPPGSGKSSFMDRLLRRARKEHSTSTGVCNSVIIVDISIDNPATFHSVTVEDSNTWNEVEYDESLVRHMTDQPAEAKASSFTQKFPPTEHFNPTKLSTTVHQSDAAAELSDNIDTTKLLKVSSKMTEKITKIAVKCGGYGRLKNLKNSYSLYLRDTGGQVEFQEMIAVLIYGPSIFFFVFRLDCDFQSKLRIEYRVSESESTNSYPSSITTEDAFLQCLASVFAMDTSSGKIETHKPLVFVVGTHKDMLGLSAREKKIAELNKHLNKLIVENGFDKLVQYANDSKGQVMFTIDNTSEDDEDVKPIRSKIHNLISSRKEFNIEYPYSYLLFCLELQNLKCSVLSLGECKAMAAEYGIVGDQVSHLLQFLHLRIGVIQYFNVDGLKHIVVKEPQVLFNKVTNLIIRTFSSEALTTKEHQDFKKGVLTASVLESAFGSRDQISSEEFLKLLKHLRIITPYLSTTPGDQEERYFIPCVLNHVSECSNEGLSTNILPLYVQFRIKHCPKGLFGVLVTHLMTPESDEEPDTSFTLLQDKIFKDQVSFEVHSKGVHDEMSLKYHPSHLKITFFPESSQHRDTSIQEVCSSIREVVGVSISKSLVNLHYREDIVKPVMCLKCDNCSELHPVEMGNQHHKINCKTTKETIRIPAKGRCWYSEDVDSTRSSTPSVSSGATSLPAPKDPDSSSYVSSLPASACHLLEQQLDWDNGNDKDLIKIAYHMIEWEEKLSCHLGLTEVDVYDIKHNLRLTTPELLRREALRKWKNYQGLTITATYRNLLELFVKAEHTKCAEALCDALCERVKVE